MEHNVEKTIVNGANETSLSSSLDKMAIENFISNLQQQVVNGLESNTANDILTTDINLTAKVSTETAVQNESSSSDASKLENNLSTSSSSQQSEAAAATSADAAPDINEDISDMVNKIVQDAVVKAKQMIEEEERLIVDSFEMVEKTELTEKELEQIANDEQRSVDLAEVKLSGGEAEASIDPNTSSIAYSAGSPVAKASSSTNNQTAIVNESNTTLNSTTTSKKASNKKSPDVDCFSCTVL
jgi:hypothetical protein